MQKKTRNVIEFGDFQTPQLLAHKICKLLKVLRIEPRSILEPNCGQGNLLFEALDTFPSAEKAIGLDISQLYISEVESNVRAQLHREKLIILQKDFFQANWDELIQHLPEPTLIIGNPPWITSSQVASLGGLNVPLKSNFQKHRGLDAKTGKSNFDISEWMLIQCLEWLNGRNADLAMLCKTTVSRKLLKYAYENHLNIKRSAIYHIDALKYFGASVDACLFICRFERESYNYDCSVYDSIDDSVPERVIGYRDNNLVSKAALYEKWKHLRGENVYKWRSGIKHDCSKVVELTKEGGKYRNGFGQLIEMEDTFVYPMLKTSEVAKLTSVPTRYMIVTQQMTGEDTTKIKDIAPKTWAYLESYGHLFDKRGSVIYKNRPRFSVFGIGDYSFSPWKVAISGFYKRLQFKLVGPAEGKAIVLDDSSYFLSCKSKAEAVLITKLLNSTPALEFFESLVFWDSKRPITTELLKKISLLQVARELNLESELEQFVHN
jgi:methylase of polypeptide subunit release factors